MHMSLISGVKQLLYSLLFSPIVLRQLIKVFRIIATTGKGSNLCLKAGFLPVPVDFHSPVPDIDDLEKRNVWGLRSGLEGIDLKVDAQLELLNELGSNYSDECQWPLSLTGNSSEFYLQNNSFSYGCGASTHCMIRYCKPETVIEIGSGMSSIVISDALSINHAKDRRSSKYIIVDPYPSNFAKSGSLGTIDCFQTRVELLDSAFFNCLKDNDILFIDSGHCVRIGGDVNYLFLDVLPRLEPGVIVHIHDISMPYEYPKVYATSETFRQFWTEQYLLQSFLSFNNEFEVLLAMHYLMKDHGKAFKKAFPYYNPDIHRLTSGSFWIRRKK
jgi:hypothetical protein